MADIEIEIDGRTLTARSDQTVIQVADEAGIYIPRFCYHKHLSVAANCRMCLVDVEKSPKALPACATPVMPGMKVFTRTQKTIDAQRAVMEFLLINHPLDCPICDQGGECELQDLSMGYGSSHSHYDECKRSVADEDIGPLVATEMTRCILCTRCVRFGDEIAGLRELGLINRGGEVEVRTYVKHAMQSEVAGNIIDLCPVGALTSKPYRFTARAWELDQAPSVSPHDCLGSNVFVHTRYGEVKRVVTRENMAINETWISDRDRFAYAGLYHVDRLEEPRIKVHGKWQVVDWQQALEFAADGLKQTIAEFGADKVGALASPSSTLEEFYLLQKLMRALGSPHIDHRLREKDTQDQAKMGAFPGLGMPIAELDQVKNVLLIGSNLRKEQPVAALRIRKAVRRGAQVSIINPIDFAFNFNTASKMIVSPQEMVATLSALLKAVGKISGKTIASDIDSSMNDDASIEGIAKQLTSSNNLILLGALSANHPEASSIRYLAQQLATLTGAKIGFMTEGANSAGAWLAGAVPHRHVGGDAINHVGLNAYEMLEKPRKGYVLLNVEPEFDCANAAHAIAALQQAKFVVALSLYRNAILDEHANVILPIAAFTETSGTFVNTAGDWQSFTGVANAFQSSRPAWKVLRVLGNFLELENFHYESSEEVKHEVKALVEPRLSSLSLGEFTQPANFTTKIEQGLTRIGEIPLYAIDSLVRRSTPLQEAQVMLEGKVASIRLHPETAAQLGLEADQIAHIQQGSAEQVLPVEIDARIAKNAAAIAGGILETAMLGDLIGKVEIRKA